MSWRDWVPFLTGSDGLTGRQRRQFTRKFWRGLGLTPKSTPERTARLEEMRASVPPTYVTRCTDDDCCPRLFHYSLEKPTP